MGQHKGCKPGVRAWGNKYPPPKSNGRPPLPPEIKEIRKLTTKEFIERINKYLYLSKDQLKAGISKGNIEVLDLCIRASLVKCIEKGDYYMLDKMMERLIGKPREAGGGEDADERLNKLIESMDAAARAVVTK